MAETQATPDHPLLAALAALYQQIAENPQQPLVTLAEAAVVHWTRVVDGLEVVQPRLNEQGFLPTAFHFGIEPDPANRMEDAGIPPGPTPGPEVFEQALAGRLTALAGHLDTYFHHPGYRSSSDQCDLLMVELARFSRFLGTWALEAELLHHRRWKSVGRQVLPPVDLYAPSGEDSLLWRVRWSLAFWEPYVHAAIVTWEANTLEPFDRALQALQGLLALPEAERAEHLQPPGYPMRSRGRPRLKVSVLEPEQRPLRTRTVLWVRYNQLVERILAVAEQAPERLDDLATDVRHFIRMVQSNYFMVAAEPGFLAHGRPGVPVVRGRTTVHPILLDPQGFFKKAVLFHNGTYTIAGGGLDRMYLQFRQLERCFKFEGWSGRGRPLRPVLESCLIAWEENRWDAFTEGLLHLAELLRGEQPGQP